MPYRIDVLPSAVKTLKKLPRKVQVQIDKEIQAL